MDLLGGLWLRALSRLPSKVSADCSGLRAQMVESVLLTHTPGARPWFTHVDVPTSLPHMTTVFLPSERPKAEDRRQKPLPFYNKSGVPSLLPYSSH